MTSYKQDELFSASEIVKNFSAITSKLSHKQIDKVGILKNNKLGFVLFRSEDFEDIVRNEVRKALFEEDKKFVDFQVQKIKNHTAKFLTFEEVAEILE
ncbi:MAG: hypothetical protein IE880_00885 [Epsilonproteobacteria bacterium]|nr:hypothetical protein [Campylobacterota bacterium]